MKQLAVLILVLCASILFDGCKKYPEGPAYSFKSKKERVANTWKLDAVINNGSDSAAYFINFYRDYTLSLTKKGSYTLSYSQVRNYGPFFVSEEGDWSFSSGKEDLKITPKSTSYGVVPSPSVFQILKLYENELWLRHFYADGKSREYHFSTKY